MALYKLISDGVKNTETKESVPNASGNRAWGEYQEWLTEGNTPDPADPPPDPPTNEEIYDQAMKNNAIIKAMALALNDGSFVPGSNYTNPEIKAIIKDKM